MSTSRVEMLERFAFDTSMPPAEVEERLVDAGTKTPMGHRG
jgi:hypothetical protein